MRKTVALFRNTRFDFDTIRIANVDGTFYSDSELVQLSHVIEIEFAELPAADVVKHQLDALDTAEEDVRRKFAEALATIDNKRAELRALTYTPEV